MTEEERRLSEVKREASLRVHDFRHLIDFLKRLTSGLAKTVENLRNRNE